MSYEKIDYVGFYMTDLFSIFSIFILQHKYAYV